MKKHILAAIVAVTLVSGCSMAPDYQLPSVKVSELYFNADTKAWRLRPLTIKSGGGSSMIRNWMPWWPRRSSKTSI